MYGCRRHRRNPARRNVQNAQDPSNQMEYLSTWLTDQDAACTLAWLADNGLTPTIGDALSQFNVAPTLTKTPFNLNGLTWAASSMYRRTSAPILGWDAGEDCVFEALFQHTTTSGNTLFEFRNASTNQSLFSVRSNGATLLVYVDTETDSLTPYLSHASVSLVDSKYYCAHFVLNSAGNGTVYINGANPNAAAAVAGAMNTATAHNISANIAAASGWGKAIVGIKFYKGSGIAAAWTPTVVAAHATSILGGYS